MKWFISSGTRWIEFLRIRFAEEDATGFAKTFPDLPSLSQMLGGSAFQNNGLAFLQELDEVGKTLVEWWRGNVHSGLIQHPENLLNHSYNEISFCNSCILPVSSRIVSCFSTNLRLAIVSKV